MTGQGTAQSADLYSSLNFSHPRALMQEYRNQKSRHTQTQCFGIFVIHHVKGSYQTHGHSVVLVQAWHEFDTRYHRNPRLWYLFA